MKRSELAILCTICVWAGVSLYLSLGAYATEKVLTQALRLSQRGQYEQAEHVLNRLSLFPASAEVTRAQGNVLRLKGLFRRDRAALEASLQYHERATRLNALDASLHLDLAWTALQLGDMKAAEASARAALSRDPYSGYALYTRGRIQEQQGLYTEAAASYRQALSARRDPQLAARLRDLPAP